MDVGIGVQAPDLEDLVGALKHFEESQLPFALSRAMNRAAKDSVGRIRDDLSSVFDLRSRSLARTFGPTGRMGDVSRGWSNKSQWPDLSVEIHSQAHAMGLQEDGGIKPFQSSEVWIGTRVIPKSATTGKKAAKYQPSRIKRRLESGRQTHKTTRIFERNGTVYERERATEEITPLYLRRPRAVVRPALGAEESVSGVFASNLSDHFQTEMERASRSRR